MGQKAEHIILVGMMGVGKSSLGSRLGKRLNMPFVDSDMEIERAAGMGITELYESYGEDELRALERRVLHRLLAGPPHVIATGGDAFADDETRAMLIAGGTTIWLQAGLETLSHRIRRLEHRPLLQDVDLRATLDRLLKEREPQYAEAALSFDTDALSVPDLIEAIVAAVRKD
ncbi:MAG: shikimate kinase [Bdellovibrionales bacterium]